MYLHAPTKVGLLLAYFQKINTKFFAEERFIYKNKFMQIYVRHCNITANKI